MLSKVLGSMLAILKMTVNASDLCLHDVAHPEVKGNSISIKHKHLSKVCNK